MNWLLEMGGIVIVILDAWRRFRAVRLKAQQARA